MPSYEDGSPSLSNVLAPRQVITMTIPGLSTVVVLTPSVISELPSSSVLTDSTSFTTPTLVITTPPPETAPPAVSVVSQSTSSALATSSSTILAAPTSAFSATPSSINPSTPSSTSVPLSTLPSTSTITPLPQPSPNQTHPLEFFSNPQSHLLPTTLPTTLTSTPPTSPTPTTSTTSPNILASPPKLIGIVIASCALSTLILLLWLLRRRRHHHNHNHSPTSIPSPTPPLSPPRQPLETSPPSPPGPPFYHSPRTSLLPVADLLDPFADSNASSDLSSTPSEGGYREPADQRRDRLARLARRNHSPAPSITTLITTPSLPGPGAATPKPEAEAEVKMKVEFTPRSILKSAPPSASILMWPTVPTPITTGTALAISYPYIQHPASTTRREASLSARLLSPLQNGKRAAPFRRTVSGGPDGFGFVGTAVVAGGVGMGAGREMGMGLSSGTGPGTGMAGWAGDGGLGTGTGMGKEKEKKGVKWGDNQVREFGRTPFASTVNSAAGSVVGEGVGERGDGEVPGDGDGDGDAKNGDGDGDTTNENVRDWSPFGRRGWYGG